MVSSNLSRHLLAAMTTAAALVGGLTSESALARNSYCCNDANGKLACGDMLPQACQGRAYRIRDEKGRTVKEVEAPLTAEQRKLRDAQDARKKEEEKQAADQRRRDQALLATYPDEKDIDKARDRALAEFEKGSAELNKRLDDAMKRRKKLDGEKDFYQKKPLPANLKKQLDDNEAEIKTAQEGLDKRKDEAEKLKADFEEKRARYRELRSGKAGVAAPPAATADKRSR